MEHKVSPREFIKLSINIEVKYGMIRIKVNPLTQKEKCFCAFVWVGVCTIGKEQQWARHIILIGCLVAATLF